MTTKPITVPIQPSFIPFEKKEIETSIPARFEKQVARYANCPAIQTNDQMLTYSQLNQAANQLARAIIARCGSVSEPIAILLEPGAQIIVAILAIVKAGKFWSTLDPALPPARMDYILQELDAPLIITDEKNLPLVGNLATQVKALNLETLDPTLSGENLALTISPDDLAYVLYTSGSTGYPKGVMHTHRNVLQFLWWHTISLSIGCEDRVGLLASFSHLSGITAMFRALFNGAMVLPYNIKEEGIAHLAAWLRQTRVTVYQSVPTVFRHLVDTLTDTEQFPDLRLIHLGGEPVSRQDVLRWKKHFADDSILLNNLGCTEASTIRQFFMTKEILLENELVPVGYEIADKTVLLLDEAGQEVAVGEPGEIAVKSAYLTPGYWKRPDLTAAAFVPTPPGTKERIYRTGDLGRLLPDGCLVHLGRKDSQIKIRGQRVEAGEVEATLLAHKHIRAAVVTVQQTETEPYLTAYFVPCPGVEVTQAQLRDFLNQELPSYMVPSFFVMLEALPQLPNGKIDRQALPSPDTSHPNLSSSFVAPTGQIETLLAGLWQETLRVEQIGVHDNFFELGGHSLLATRVMSRLSQDYQIELSLRQLFEYRTIAELAPIIEKMLLSDVDN